MKLKKENEHLVLDNQGLVYYQLRKYGVNIKSPHYDELISIGNFALTKAAVTFDQSKNTSFSTYALRCIRNEMTMYFRKVNKYSTNISMEEPMRGKSIKNDLKIEDALKDSHDFEEELRNKTEYVRIMSIILNCLEGKERLSILYFISNEKQEKIAKNLKLSQAYISRLQKRAIQKTKNIALEEEKYQVKFDIGIAQNSKYEYQIEFELKDVVRDKAKIKKISKWIKNIKKDLSFEIECKEGKVLVQMFPHKEAIIFLAKLIQKIEE